MDPSIWNNIRESINMRHCGPHTNVFSGKNIKLYTKFLPLFWDIYREKPEISSMSTWGDKPSRSNCGTWNIFDDIHAICICWCRTFVAAVASLIKYSLRCNGGEIQQLDMSWFTYMKIRINFSLRTFIFMNTDGEIGEVVYRISLFTAGPPVNLNNSAEIILHRKWWSLDSSRYHKNPLRKVHEDVDESPKLDLVRDVSRIQAGEHGRCLWTDE